MGPTVTLLIAGDNANAVADVAAHVRNRSDRNIIRRVTGVLEAIRQDAHDVRVVVLTDDAQAQVEALTRLPAEVRKPTVLVSASDDPRLLREAMRAGARDFFVLPVSEEELNEALTRIEGESNKPAAAGRVTTFINARGGAGGSVLAATAAHAIALHTPARVALVDLDLQFGALPLYFDLAANRGLLDAIKTLDLLDGPALEAHMLKHASGLHVLAAPDDHLLAPGEIPAPRLQSLLGLIGQHYDHVVLDLPRQLDAFAAAALQSSERIGLVIQQNLSHLREAKRLAQILRGELKIPPQRIVIVVNRWEKTNALSLRDIQQALPDYACLTVRNDYRRVSETVSLGTPLLEASPHAPVAQDIMALAEGLTGIKIARRKGLLARLLS